MASSKLVVQVHFGSSFDWSFGCVYVGGEVEVHNVGLPVSGGNLKITFEDVDDDDANS